MKIPDRAPYRKSCMSGQFEYYVEESRGNHLCCGFAFVHFASRRAKLDGQRDGVAAVQVRDQATDFFANLQALLLYMPLTSFPTKLILALHSCAYDPLSPPYHSCKTQLKVHYKPHVDEGFRSVVDPFVGNAVAETRNAISIHPP